MGLGFPSQTSEGINAIIQKLKPDSRLFLTKNWFKTLYKRLFGRTNRKMAARMDFCPHGREVGAHGTANFRTG
jgi:hypothetical protein